MKRTHPPALLLEQLALDELLGERRKALEQELGAATVAAAVAQLRADNAALAERFAPENLPSPTRLQQLAERARSSQRSARMHRVDLVLQRLVLAGVVMLAVTSPMWLPGSGADRALPADSAEGPALEPTRIKGGARLFAFRKRGARVDPLPPGATARAGDLLQLGYDAGGRAYGVLLSLDGRGVVTLHHPRQPGGSTALQAGGRVLLSSAYALDDAPRFERFVLVTSEQPIDVAAVVRAAERLAPNPADAARARLDLPPALDQRSLLIDKEVP